MPLLSLRASVACKKGETYLPTKLGTFVLRRNFTCPSPIAGVESNTVEVLSTRYSRESDLIRLNWPLHTVYQESSQTKILDIVENKIVTMEVTMSL
jgi:hypothetical protein